MLRTGGRDLPLVASASLGSIHSSTTKRPPKSFFTKYNPSRNAVFCPVFSLFASVKNVLVSPVPSSGCLLMETETGRWNQNKLFLEDAMDLVLPDALDWLQYLNKKQKKGS